VAAELGFADQSHLVRVFRRSVHLAPGSLRERLIADDADVERLRTTASKTRPAAAG
jgi:AraC-like DNA-binding protein